MPNSRKIKKKHYENAIKTANDKMTKHAQKVPKKKKKRQAKKRETKNTKQNTKLQNKHTQEHEKKREPNRKGQKSRDPASPMSLLCFGGWLSRPKFVTVSSFFLVEGLTRRCVDASTFFSLSCVDASMFGALSFFSVHASTRRCLDVSFFLNGPHVDVFLSLWWHHQSQPRSNVRLPKSYARHRT